MTRILFAIPGELSARTGGYVFDRRVLEAWAAQGVDAVHCPLPSGFPEPSPADVAASVYAIARRRRAGDVVLIDGLAYGALPEDAIRAIASPIVGLCHHPLCLETGLSAQRAAALRESERRALRLATHVIVTSAHTGALLAQEFSVSPEKLTVAAPGVDPVSRATGSGGATTLLAVGAIIPRKAFDLLVEALSQLVDLDWRLRIVGGTSHAPATSAAVQALIAAKRLGTRIELAGELSNDLLDRAYDMADLFVSSSLYEGYGMALAQALARGLPVVTTTGGAAAQTVPDKAALKVPPGDVDALREGLRRAIGDAAVRARLADASWSAGQSLPRWDATARIVAQVASQVLGRAA